MTYNYELEKAKQELRLEAKRLMEEAKRQIAETFAAVASRQADDAFKTFGMALKTELDTRRETTRVLQEPTSR